MEEENTLINLKNAFVFQGKNLVLNGVDVKVRKGEFIYLIGKQAAAKAAC